MDAIKEFFCHDTSVFTRLIWYTNPWKTAFDACVKELNVRAARLRRERVKKLILIAGVAVFFLWAANRQE